jgi:predicted ATPase
LLREEGYLHYINNSWNWDVREIISRTSISDNVVKIAETKLHTLAKPVQFLLKIASCLGFRFPKDVLEHFMIDNFSSGDVRYATQVREHLECCLKIAVKEGLIEPAKNESKFKFTHKRLLQAIRGLDVSGLEESSMFQMSLGSTIWQLSHDGKREWYVLSAAEQLNKCTVNRTDDDEKEFIQNINIKASKIARSRCAFGPAAEFLEAALLFMNKEAWEVKYDAILTIHCMAAEMNMAAGRFDQCKAHIMTVISNARSSFDKMPAYFICMQSLGAQSKISDAIDMGRKGLLSLGENTPLKPKAVNILYDLIRTRQLIKGFTDEGILGMQSMKSKEKLAAMRLLSGVLIYAILAEEPELVAFAAMRMTRISLNGGISRVTPLCLAAWTVFGNQKESQRFTSLSIQLANKMEDKAAVPLTYVLAHSSALHNASKIKDSLTSLDEGFKRGVNEAQIFPAALCRSLYLSISLFSGCRLQDTEREARTLCKILRERNERFTILYASSLWQVSLNLLGDPKNENPTTLSGTAMSDMDDFSDESKASSSVFMSIYVWEAFLSLIFGDLNCDVVFLEKLRTSEKSFRSHFIFYFMKLYEGLAYFENFRKTKKRNFLLKGRKALKVMRGLTHEGGLTSIAFAELLEAEDTATRGNMTHTSQAYEKAIDAFQRADLIPFEAFACERVGALMSHERMILLAQTYLERSMLLYKNWGAKTKLIRLQQIMPNTQHKKSFQETAVGAKTIPSDANAMWSRQMCKLGSTRASCFEGSEAALFGDSRLNFLNKVRRSSTSESITPYS